MRIEFEDSSFIDFIKTDSGNIIVSIAAETMTGQKIINSAEITIEQFNSITNEFSKPKKPKKKVEKTNKK